MSAAEAAPLPIQTDSPFLRELLSNPIQFGDVYSKTSFAPTQGVREVQPGPPSPPPRAHLPLHANAEAGPSTPPRQNGFIGPVIPSASRHAQPSPAGASPASAKPAHISNGRTTAPARPLAQPTPSPSPAKGKGRESTLPPLHPPIPIHSLAWPAHLRDRKAPAGGLHNPSMACYANATLQVLLHTPALLCIMESHKECLLSHKRQFCFLCILRDLPHWSSKRYSPREVHTNLGLIKKGFNRNRQEDAHEFFRFVTDALQNTALAGLPKTLPNALKHTTWVYRLWGGQVRSRVVCSRCLKPSDTFDDFLDLSLDCHVSKRTVGQMLQGYVKEERLEGDNNYHCENCKAKAPATKSFRISASPPILTLHLKRFSVNYNAYSGRARADKFTQHIDFPTVLDLAPYMIEHETPVSYRLFGVTCHRGAELRYGHYTSYVKGPSGMWWNCDDDDVSPVKIEEIKRDRSAYLLSYVRVEGVPGEATAARANGATTPLVTPRTNGHTPSTAGHTNGHTPRSSASAANADLLPSSPLKRKRDLDDPMGPPSSVRRVRSPPPPSSPPDTMPNLFPSKLDNSRTVPSDRFYAKPPPAIPSSPVKSPQRGVQGWQAGSELSKSQKKKLKKKERRDRQKLDRGAPMPFAQGRQGGGMSGMKGRVGRMQPKK